jgi:hypothetical protein
MGGLGFGVLLAGVVSQWAGAPLRLIFWVCLALLVPAAIGLWAMPEPVTRTSRPRLRARLPRVPSGLGHVFVRAALAAFAGFAVLGLFTAVAPAFLGPALGVTNRAAVGLVVVSVFAASTAGQAILALLPDDLALPAGCVALIAGMALLALSLAGSSLALLVAASVTAGVGHGLSFRAGLAALSAGSPPAQRAEVASSFFLVAYVGISLPVIGEGALARAIGLRPPGLAFAAAVATLAALALTLRATTSRRRARPARPPALPSPRAA